MRTKFAIIIFVLTAIVLPLPAAADGLRSFLEGIVTLSALTLIDFSV